MKISTETLEILGNFRHLNPGAVFKEGNVIKTRHDKAPVPIVKAVVQEHFPRDFALANLQGFLSVHSLLDDPDLEFTDTHIVLKDKNKRTAKIKYAAPTMVVHHDYSKGVKLPSVDSSFRLPVGDFKAILKAAGTLMAPEIAFVGNGETVSVTTYDSNNTGQDTFVIDLGETSEVFTMIINAKYLQLLVRDYTVEISFKGLLKFESVLEDDRSLTYWIAASEKSKVQ